MTTLDCQLSYSAPQYVNFPLYLSHSVTIQHFGTKCGPNTGSSNTEEPHNIIPFEILLHDSYKYYKNITQNLRIAITMLYNVTTFGLNILALIILDIGIFYRIWLMEPILLCKLLYLRMSRFITLRHDYLANIQNVKLNPPRSFLRNFILILLSTIIALESIHLTANHLSISLSTRTAHSRLLQIQTSKYKQACTSVSLGDPMTDENSIDKNDQEPMSAASESLIKKIDITINQVGGGIMSLQLETILPFIPIKWQHENCAKYPNWKYSDHINFSDFTSDMIHNNILTIPCFIPFDILRPHLTIKNAKKIAKMHSLPKIHHMAQEDLLNLLAQHRCSSECQKLCTLISPYTKSKAMSSKERYNRWYSKKKEAASGISNLKDTDNTIIPLLSDNNLASSYEANNIKFPPSPPSESLLHKIISGFIADTEPSKFEEAGCASCGLLCKTKNLISLDSISCSLTPLIRSEITRMERHAHNEPIQDIPGPVIDTECNHICTECHSYLQKNQIPPFALARGFWIGKVPKQLTSLTYVEKLLIARVRHNRCVVKVASGRYKMRANAITFQHPISKIYNTLPPSCSELDEILAVVFTGPCQPTIDDIKRTPFLVRRNKVYEALKWLKLNHIDYYDIDISNKNLNEYPECDAPVSIEYRTSLTNKDHEATSVHDNEDEDGVETGPCSFSVQGLTSEEYSTMTIDAIKTVALNHLVNDGKAMFVGHSKNPESIFNNARLYPSMMPWLFPYGKGAIGQELMKKKHSINSQKRYFLMYHDKRFQIDPNFPLIAFNHAQIMQSTLSGYLLAKKSNFNDIANRLLNLNIEVVNDISNRLSTGEHVKPQTEEEKTCFKLLTDLDMVGGQVQGSMSSKKFMRNEIWSLMSYLGAPSWFITISPADIKHPICLYFADNCTEFKPDIRLPDEAYRLIAGNPVAAARFFHIMCTSFIKNVLGVGADHPGLYGETSGYYGTVEQQGRLTLHLHLLLWIQNSLSPQEIRNRIMDQSSTFQKEMVEYLESVHQGEMITGSLENIKAQVKESKLDTNYVDPTQTMPECPPPLCIDKNCQSLQCIECQNIRDWQQQYERITDDILSRSNYHTCNININGKNNQSLKKGCLNSKGQCKARFPRDIIPNTLVEPQTGALRMKKGEAWINTFTPALTYLTRCNTDVTSLLSGTAIKAVIAYVTDYVTKPGLTTYSIFDSVRQVFSRKSEMIGGSTERQQAARSLMTKMINSLTAKMEIGSPMASLYLLGNPDHYTKHEFVPFYWKNFVRETRKPWEEQHEIENPEKVIVNKNSGKFIGVSSVQDYIYRPSSCENINLYNWIRLAKKERKNKRANDNIDSTDESDNEDLTKTVESDIITVDSTSNHFLYFLKEHPQSQTHYIKYTAENHTKVPNFIGGSLPRRDQGDKDYYCSVMLSLFKPWRDGRNLRNNEESWTAAFDEHVFSIQEKKLMDNFNLRYECNDARDDFSAQAKKNIEEDNTYDLWPLDNEDHNDISQDQDMLSDCIENNDEINTDPFLDIYPDTDFYLKQADMKHMEQIITNTGWLNSQNDNSSQKSITSYHIPRNKTSTEWKAIVQKTKQNIIAERSKNIPNITKEKIQTVHTEGNVEGEVIVSDLSYIDENFQADSIETQNLINDVVSSFTLNEEQDRAFRIVANHASIKAPKQLKMYLGGMGGTGKSQVIKALTNYFERKKESHRIIILAPTGTAAALINGSTYHSVLGIKADKSLLNQNEHTSLAQVCSRLNGVDYIFLDEVSMVSCSDFYHISSQLAKACNIFDLPFGGMNMIFAGDFAQLAPVNAQPLYSGSVGTSIDSSTSEKGQTNAIGKAIWHQVTTVVILRKNMRQNTQSCSDAQLRTALENMRYAACTQDDLDFLRSKIVHTNGMNLQADEFNNIPIITARNIHKDCINIHGSLQFAQQTGQTLTTFYSIDTQADSNDSTCNTARKKPKNRTNYNTKITETVQKVLWDLPPASCSGVPGKLSLCIGLPVMIKHNEATELCITKGQEAHVVGWNASTASNGQQILDTLFVELYKPAKNVKIGDLPINIVPLGRISTVISCKGTGAEKKISRSQVPILPNFAMTDYASQGKTRPINIVDLTNCRTHMAYYVALSRGSTANGMAILRPFSEEKIICGTSGYLRQEFRELELLDEITLLRFTQKLPPSINGKTRNIIIQQYRDLIGKHYCPSRVDGPLRWTEQDPLIVSTEDDSEWSFINAKSNKASNKNKISNKNTSFIPAVGSKDLQFYKQNQKRKIDSNFESDIEISKKIKKSKLIPTKEIDNQYSIITIYNSSQSTQNNLKRKFSEIDNKSNINSKRKCINNISNLNSNNLSGMTWDSVNHSCAYDALFTIMYHIWCRDIHYWSQKFSQLGENSQLLAESFNQVVRTQITLNNARDNVRHRLYLQHPISFPYGTLGTDMSELLTHMVKNQNILGTSVEICSNCHHERELEISPSSIIFITSSQFKSTNNTFLNWQDSIGFCERCEGITTIKRRYNQNPGIIAFSIQVGKVSINKVVQVMQAHGPSITLPLKGIIYISNHHFSIRIITSQKEVWFHDGITTGPICIYEGPLSNFSDKTLQKHNNGLAIGAIYAKN